MRRLRSDRQDTRRALLRERQLPARGRRHPRRRSSRRCRRRDYRVQESLTDRFANLLPLQDDLARRFATALDQSRPSRCQAASGKIPTAHLVAGGVSVGRRSQRLYLAGRYHEAIERLQRPSRRTTNTPTRGRCSARVTRGSRKSRRSTADERPNSMSQALTASLRAVEINPHSMRRRCRWRSRIAGWSRSNSPARRPNAPST